MVDETTARNRAVALAADRAPLWAKELPPRRPIRSRRGFRNLSTRTLAAIREIVLESRSFKEAVERVRRRYKLRPEQAEETVRRVAMAELEGEAARRHAEYVKEYGLQPVTGATLTPLLPVLEKGKLHLDFAPLTTVNELCERIRLLDTEIFAVFDPETLTLTHAPIVGEGGEVEWSRFADVLRGKLVVHNHPNGSLFSPDDFTTCFRAGLKELQIVLPNKGRYSLTPKGSAWETLDLRLPHHQDVMERVYRPIRMLQRAYRDWNRELEANGTPPTPVELREEYNRRYRELFGNPRTAPKVGFRRIKE